MLGSLDLLAVFNALPGAYLLLTPALVIEAASDAYLKDSFTARDSLIGRYLFDVFGGEPGSAEATTMINLRASLQQVLATGQSDQMPVQHYNLVEPTTGAVTERYWQPLNTPIRDAQGTVTAIVHSVADVTAQTRAAAALRLAQAREQQAQAAVEAQHRHLQQVLLYLPAQIATYRGPEYVYDFVNVRYTQPLPTRQYLGRPIREVLPEVAAQGLLDVFDRVYRTGEPHHFPEQELWLDVQGTGQPEQLYLDFYLHPLRDATGHIYGLLDFTYNVTAQVHARQQVQQLNDELETRVQARTHDLEAANRQLVRTNVDLDNFIYTASHDLKQPIANIEGLLLALREHLPAEGPSTALVFHLLALMQQDVERFQLTLHQLTNLTRLQQAHEVPVEAVDVAATVDAVRLDLAPLLAGAHFTADVSPSLNLPLPPQYVRSLLYNLLSNALKYRHPDRGPVVHLRGYTSDNRTVLEMQDNGLGLTDAQQGQLFGLFKRLHDHVPGSGMGLFMVKRMVENASGRIDVHSQAGVGSIFTVTFPA